MGVEPKIHRIPARFRRNNHGDFTKPKMERSRQSKRGIQLIQATDSQLLESLQPGVSLYAPQQQVTSNNDQLRGHLYLQAVATHETIAAAGENLDHVPARDGAEWDILVTLKTFFCVHHQSAATIFRYERPNFDVHHQKNTMPKGFRCPKWRFQH